MEALRLIKRLGLRPRRTLRCVLWTNEESGARGANAYADSLGTRIDKHVAAIESDGGVERPVGFEVGVNRAGTDSSDAARTALAVARLSEVGRLLTGIGADRITGGGGRPTSGRSCGAASPVSPCAP